MNVDDVLLLSYKRCGDIENHYRHFKQYLGMGGYQVRSIEIGVAFLLLVERA